MKEKKQSELKNLIEVTKKKEKIKKEKVDWKWIIIVLIVSFMISFFMSFISEMTIPKFPLWAGIIITLLFIMLGILFDIIGVLM